MKSSFWFLVVVVCLLLGPVPAMAAEEVEEERGLGFWFEARTFGDGETPSRFTGWYERELAGSVGFYALIERESDGYHEWYVGPTVRPFPWLQIGLGFGRETVPGEINGERRNAFFEIDWEQINVSGTFENGESGRWHRVTTTYTLNDYVGVGVIEETDFDVGPRIELNLGSFQIWGAVFRTLEGETLSTVAVNASF